MNGTLLLKRVVGGWLCAAHAAALAQPAAAVPKSPEVAQAPSVQSVVVTADRWPLAPWLPGGGALETTDSTVSLIEIPAASLQRPGQGSLAAALASVPSVGENFAAVGYYENFTIRGFTLDMGSAFRVNGMVVPGEWQFPLEATARLQVVAGVAGSSGGWVGGGGALNQITPRANLPTRVHLEADARGGSLVALKVGGGEPGFAWHATASSARIRPAYPGAEGNRHFAGVAVDVAQGPAWRLYLDAAVQHRSQPVVPGFQLRGGTTPPDLSLRRVNLNAQPWSRPVVNDGALGMLRAEGLGPNEIRWDVGVSRAQARIDDNLATPFGCNTPPFEFFCSNGDYVLYDYHASEKRSTVHLRAAATLPLNALGLKHQFQAGMERIERKVVQSNVFSATSYDAGGAALSGNIFQPELDLPQPAAAGVDRPATERTQRTLSVGHATEAGSWRSVLGARWTQIDGAGNSGSARHLLPRWTLSWRWSTRSEVFAGVARGLEFGSEAPATAVNAGDSLAPRVTRQVELGWRVGGEAFRSGVTAFRSERPWEFVEPTGSSWAGRGDWVQRGRERHSGIEAHFSWDLGSRAALQGRLSRTDAIGTGSGLAGWDGRQLQNIPKVGLHLRLEQALAGLPGCSYSAALNARSSKSANATGAVQVGGYGVLDLGLSCDLSAAATPIRVEIGLHNATDRRYWRDTGQAYSADLLFPGAPRAFSVVLRLGGFN